MWYQTTFAKRHKGRIRGLHKSADPGTIIGSRHAGYVQYCLPCRSALCSRPPSPTCATLSTMSFQSPRKAILTPDQLAHFQQSKTHQDIIGFIEELNERVVGVKLTDECALSPVCE